MQWCRDTSIETHSSDWQIFNRMQWNVEWSLITTAWRVVSFRLQETAARNGG
jgi:hypothetical protein